MYMWVSPDIRSAAYQAARTAGTQRQSGTPANHRFIARDSANRAITHQGAAFIIGGGGPERGTLLSFSANSANLEPAKAMPIVPSQRRAASLVQSDDGRRRDRGAEPRARGGTRDRAWRQS